MALVGVQEAATLLGVSPRRVRQMIADKKLPARRVGRAWAIDENDLRQQSARRPAHRPWKPASAWAVLAAAEGKSPPQPMAAHDLHRARKRAAEGLQAIVGQLSERAERRSFYAHPSDLSRILASADTVRAGASAAADHGIDLIGEGTDEAYVSESTLAQIAVSHHIEERSERPNLILRVIADADWPFPEGTQVVPPAVAAVDLLESDDERSRRAGAEILGRATGRQPVIDRLPVELPAYPGSDPIWDALLDLADSRSQIEWTLIGGQMVMLHAAENQAAPLRVSRDLDIVVNARVVTGALRKMAANLKQAGFELDGVSADGIAHRYVRGQASIDLLAPEGLGRRADLTTTPPGRTVQVPGGTQALDRTERVPVVHGGREGSVPRPSLLGAIVVKAAAISVDDVPRAQEHDLALLLSMIDDPGELIPDMTRKDRKRLRAAGLENPDHPVWDALDPDVADRARLAYRSLSAPPRTEAVSPSSSSPITPVVMPAPAVRPRRGGICGQPTPTGPCRNPLPAPGGRCAAGHRR